RHLLGHRVHHAYPVSRLRQRRGVPAGGAAHVQHRGRSRRQLPGQHVPGTQELQPAGAVREPVPLALAAVVLENLRPQHEGILPPPTTPDNVFPVIERDRTHTKVISTVVFEDRPGAAAAGGWGQTMVARWWHRRGGEAHCLVRLFLPPPPGPPVSEASVAALAAKPPEVPFERAAAVATAGLIALMNLPDQSVRLPNPAATVTAPVCGSRSTTSTTTWRCWPVRRPMWLISTNLRPSSEPRRAR